MFSKVLVANRGEIAVRVLRTLREMGIRSVAVYSDADARALHVLVADEAVRLGPADPRESYLHVDRILEAARQTGAEAIHPGYGFLSENADFARQVTEAGRVFIGPPAAVIATLGDKTAARRTMAAAGVPIVPGMEAPERDLARLQAAADRIGYPVLIKAAAGGGGKGMRVVQGPAAFAGAAAEAGSEARRAFGDDALYLERYLEQPRHVEVQILADAHGNVVHLGERECSIQRRHQKLVEETPSPAVDAALRARLTAAAVAAARAAGYVNAGTVEFLLERTGAFHFLEVNTRLQVEHPVTEMVLGLDLVRHQLRIAAGEPLGFTQPDLVPRGHALECRIYAEDPATGFLPSAGTIVALRPAAGPFVRFDEGIHAGAEVPVHYDPILGKLVVWAETRDAAIARMRRALSDQVILGVPTTSELLLDLMDHPAFQAGDTHTGFLDAHLSAWQPAVDGDRNALHAWVAARWLGQGAAPPAPGTDAPAAGLPTPFQTLGAFDAWRPGEVAR
jgi:acetyl-CoA carboxylase biotin carboxylase subunit